MLVSLTDVLVSITYVLVILSVLTPLSPYFNYIVAANFSGGGSRSTRREPLTMDKELVSFITSAASLVHPFS